MTKQEAIEKKWIDTGIEFEKVKPLLKIDENIAFNFQEDGWVSFDIDFKKINGYNPELLDFIGISMCRPKTLKGIENNNGWIKIESEADLPKDVCKIWVVEKNSGEIDNIKFITPFFTPIHESCTHYQPIIKPLPPIY